MEIKIRKGGLYKKGKSIYILIEDNTFYYLDNLTGIQHKEFLHKERAIKEMSNGKYTYLGQAKDLLKAKK